MFGRAPHVDKPTYLKTIFVYNAIIATTLSGHAPPVAYWTWMKTIFVFPALIPELSTMLLRDTCVALGLCMRSQRIRKLNVLFVIGKWEWVIKSDWWDVLTCITTCVCKTGWTEEISFALLAEVRSPWDKLKWSSLFSKKIHEGQWILPYLQSLVESSWDALMYSSLFWKKISKR
jgi:hypothetical protein